MYPSVITHHNSDQVYACLRVSRLMDTYPVETEKKGRPFEACGATAALPFPVGPHAALVDEGFKQERERERERAALKANECLHHAC